MLDHVVPVRRQIALFEMIPGAEASRIDGDHDAVVALAADYIPLLIRAIRSTLDRRPVRLYELMAGPAPASGQPPDGE